MSAIDATMRAEPGSRVARSGTPTASYFSLKPYVVVATLLVLLYLEPIELGGVKLSYLWKMAGAGLLVLTILVRAARTTVVMHTSEAKAIAWASLYALVPLFSAPFSPDWSSVAVSVAQRSILPVAAFALLRRRFDSRYLTAVPVTLLLAAVPFALGELEPLGRRWGEAAVWGLQESRTQAIFQTPHAAAFGYALATLLAIQMWWRGRGRSRLIQTALVVGLVWCVVDNNMRTGVVVVVVGVLGRISTLPMREQWRRLLISAVAILIIGTSVASERSPIVNRWVGLRPQSRLLAANTFDVDRMSSMRLTLWHSTWQAYRDGGYRVWMFGMSEEGLKNEIGRRVGARLFAHNGFLNTLAANGLAGLLAMIGLLCQLWRNGEHEMGGRWRAYSRTMLLGWCAFLIFQGGDMPIHTLVMLPMFLQTERIGLTQRGTSSVTESGTRRGR